MRVAAVQAGSGGVLRVGGVAVQFVSSGGPDRG